MDIFKKLKSQDYPECVHNSLTYLVSTKVDKNSSIPGIAHNPDDHVNQIVINCIFTHAKSSQQYQKYKTPPYIRELQTIEILLNKFTALSESPVVHQLFQSLFKECHSNDIILLSLKKCVSFAVGLKNSSFLNATAYWMQNQGCCSEVVKDISEYLLQDYCEISTDVSPLRDLPNVSQIFACCFIICLTSVHSSVNKNQDISIEVLLDLISDWMLNNSSLGLSSLDPGSNAFLQTKQRQTLWTSPTKSNNQTPIPGLVLWLVKQTACLRIIDESPQFLILSKLHLSILQTILSFPTLPGSQQMDLFTLSDMQRILTEVNCLVDKAESSKRRQLSELSCKSSIETMMCPPQIAELIGERLSQILQVGLATGAFRCAITDLQTICKQIPNCLLLEILKEKHLMASTPLMHDASR